LPGFARAKERLRLHTALEKERRRMVEDPFTTLHLFESTLGHRALDHLLVPLPA